MPGRRTTSNKAKMRRRRHKARMGLARPKRQRRKRVFV